MKIRSIKPVMAWALLLAAPLVLASDTTYFGTIDAINGDFGTGTGSVAGTLASVNDNDWVTFDAVAGETVELLLSNTDDSGFLDFAIFRDENDNGVIEVGDVADVINFNVDQTGSGTDIVVQHGGWVPAPLDCEGLYCLAPGESAPFAFVAPATGQYVIGIASSNASQALDYSVEVVARGEAASTAYFRVTKTFSDGSDDEVDVHLSCNSGLPLEQDFTISGGGDGVLFVVTELQGTETVCEVTESGGPAGYTPVLNGGAGCTFENVIPGSYECVITNEADPAEFTVTKDWVIEGAV
ncbi:MAG TPA: hypothetical protein VLB27_08960, partial [candidate division Zixibacteria bacterium]|nr:hypothetical protein [candidate division Zixibacteria bacterium]